MEDSLDQGLWLQKESQIRYYSPLHLSHTLIDIPPRLINIMVLLDCGFTFFWNFPCHFSLTELNFDLTCEDILFSSPHPFSEPTFKSSRHLTANEAFKSLLTHDKSQSPESDKWKTNPLGLNHVDMFLLIHRTLLYSLKVFSMLIFSSSLHIYTHTSLALFIFYTSQSRYIKSLVTGRPRPRSSFGLQCHTHQNGPGALAYSLDRHPSQYF
jgi:hypothetical protein